MDSAVIIAAGEGTRMRPLTTTRPKPMLPVAGKPILEWNLNALAAAGVKKAVVVVGYKKEKITGYFGKKHSTLSLEYVEQTEQLGTGHAVAMADGKIKESFLVMNGDVIVSENLIKELIKDFKSKKPSASMCLAEVKEPKNYGVVEEVKGVVKSFEEKPKKPRSNLANAGVYAFNEDVFDILSKLGKTERLEYELTDAVKAYLKSGKVSAVTTKDEWIDVGLPWHLLDANEIMLKRMNLTVSDEATIEDGARLIGPVHVGKGSQVRSGCYITGPAYIGENCLIGPNNFIRPHTTIMDDCHIGASVEIKNTLIMNRSNVPHLSYVGDSIIGEGVNLGAGTNIANLRFDDSEVKVEVKETVQGSGRRKFGAIIGDNVKTGINVSILPGRAIYPGAFVEAGSVVRNTIYTE
ncbi:MAG: bifunctional sugar-1-phosphate nucleotidylyltransferase/acetyltransferase [Candidatus Altiarchaeota archaeon]